MSELYLNATISWDTMSRAQVCLIDSGGNDYDVGVIFQTSLSTSFVAITGIYTYVGTGTLVMFLI